MAMPSFEFFRSMEAAAPHRRMTNFYETRTKEHHTTIFYPNRCEHQGCNAPVAQLKTCAGCRMVRYCSIQHQKADWPLHKAECKAFKELGLKARFYTDEEMLAQYPIRAPKLVKRDIKTRTKAHSCEICNVQDSEVDMILTECCGATVCDTEDDYNPMSLSRDHCPRSHDRYTLCGTHGNGERQCDTNKDWRNCHGCLMDILHGHQPIMAFQLWKGLNCWNSAPMLAQDVPRHAICDVCRDCGQKFVAGVTGATYTKSGSIICTKCNPTADGRATGPVFSTLMI